MLPSSFLPRFFLLLMVRILNKTVASRLPSTALTTTATELSLPPVPYLSLNNINCINRNGSSYHISRHILHLS